MSDSTQSPQPKTDAPQANAEMHAESADANKAVIRYGQMNMVGLFPHSLDTPLKRGNRVIVRTERGVELGEVLLVACDPSRPCSFGCVEGDRLGKWVDESNGSVLRNRQNRILRMATPQDVNDQVHLDRAAGEKIAYCKQQIAGLALKMRLVTVEHLFGGERVIFYFTADGRVDFRDLVRRLAGQYRTRIEMRQIGARDEARLVGDYERCGQRCCCQQFLGTLQPVSIRMAKTQKATLDPSKISGRCGRLMCCLRYEDETYEDLRRRLPRRNSWVRTEDLVGRVINTQILSQLVKVIDAKGNVAVIPCEAIIERNITPPSEAAPYAAAVTKPAVVETLFTPADAYLGDVDADVALDDAVADNDGGSAAPRRTRGKRRKRGSRGSAPPAAGAQAPPPAAAGESAPKTPSAPASAASGDGEQASAAGRKRRRKRRKKPRGGPAAG